MPWAPVEKKKPALAPRKFDEATKSGHSSRRSGSWSTSACTSSSARNCSSRATWESNSSWRYSDSETGSASASSRSIRQEVSPRISLAGGAGSGPGTSASPMRTLGPNGRARVRWSGRVVGECQLQGRTTLRTAHRRSQRPSEDRTGGARQGTGESGAGATLARGRTRARAGMRCLRGRQRLPLHEACT